MNDDARYWDGLRDARSKSARGRRQRAARDFQGAKIIAGAEGMDLRRCSEFHYQLSHPRGGWLLNLYPGNQRVCGDRKRPRPPYLNLPRPWTLLGAVMASAIPTITKE